MRYRKDTRNRTFSGLWEFREVEARSKPLALGQGSWTGREWVLQLASSVPHLSISTLAFAGLRTWLRASKKDQGPSQPKLKSLPEFKKLWETIFSTP